MMVIIRCRKQKTSALSLAADPRFLSIASAHHDISGTNHRGTSYVIGSFESAASRRSKRSSRRYRSNHINDEPPTSRCNVTHLHTSDCYDTNTPCYQRLTSS